MSLTVVQYSYKLPGREPGLDYCAGSGTYRWRERAPERLRKLPVTPVRSGRPKRILGRQVGVDLHRVLVRVHDPGFRDADAGAQGQLDRAVVGDGGIGHLHDERDLCGSG